MKSQFSENFGKAYQSLNPEQKKAVDTIEGPVMVIAGPGTGKTQVLTMRIANILQKTDTPPEAILALTFTESGVASMRKRLADLIGAPAYQVEITTFHSFANAVIKDHPDEFPRIIGSTSITQIDQIRLVREVLSSASLEKLRPFGDRYFYLHSILKAINDLKGQGVSSDEFKIIAEGEGQLFLKNDDLYYASGVHKGKMKGIYLEEKKIIERNKELAIAYEAYQELLTKSHLYDYSDMIMEVMRALEHNKELLLTLQERYLYILVDEHQDTNRAQNKIIELLASYYDEPNLFVVGDEKQAIFRFQGASLENFLYFKKRFKNVTLITLRANYRSTQFLLDASHDLRPHSESLVAHSVHPNEKVKIAECSTADSERSFLAKHIAERLKKGVLPEQIAILYRENRDALPLAHLFEKIGIPFVIESDQDVLGDEHVGKLITILRALQHFGSGEELMKVLTLDLFQIEPLDTYKISQTAFKKHVNLYDIIASETQMKEAGVSSIKAIKELYEKLSRWKMETQNKGALYSFETIVRESGLLQDILRHPAGNEKLAKLHILFNQIKSFVEQDQRYTLDTFFSFLDLLSDHRAMIKSAGAHYSVASVRMMTAHKAKGLEFDYVYIIDATDGRWSSRKHAEHIKLPRSVFALLEEVEGDLSGVSDEDERNLFYVALTRAKKEVIISYAHFREDGREKLPVLFLEEMNKESLTIFDTAPYEKMYVEEKDIAFLPAKPKIPPFEDKQYLNTIFKEQGLSVTAINNYLECPWKYFYVNLVRIPETPNKNMIFGNAVHYALKCFFDKFKEEDVSVDYLVKCFEESLVHESLTKIDYEEMREKGIRALKGWYDTSYHGWKKNILNEFAVNGVALTEDITVKGKIDKIELLDMTTVSVVDYKTGKPKSRNDIEGKTKLSEGNYKRQLVFYALLLKYFQNGKYHVTSGTIDFIEPDDKGKYHSESFEITDEEVKALEVQVLTIAQEILSLSFWEVECDNKDCEYCALHRTQSK